MPSPPIQVFLTTIASQPALRQRQEYILRTLQVKKIPFTSYDLASDENAKRLWKRKAPLDKQQLPGILVGGTFPGTFGDFEEAVEYKELDTFLRLNESYDAEVDNDVAAPPAKPVGVPGASSPQQMTNQKPSFAAAPSPLKDKGGKKGSEIDAGAALDDAGLQGVNVTDEDLADLVRDLGLEGDEAGELVKGLSGSSSDKPSDKPIAAPGSPVKFDDFGTGESTPSTTENADVKSKEEETLEEERKLRA